MAYIEYPSGHLWKGRLDGSARSQLTSSPASMQQWSPDGKWLTYTDWKNLYLVSADGGGPQKLSPKSDDGVVPVMPTWLPDGRSIAWNYYPFPDRPSTGIHVIDLASRKVSVMPGSEGFYAPSWSPDGRYLIATAQNPSRMVLYSAATKTWRDLHIFEVEWGLWIWSTDSKSAYMALARKGATGIFRLTIPDGAWSQVSGLDGVTTKDGSTPPSLTPDGRPALMSHTGVVQIYSLSWKPD
jgi:eukaryotic-like serine/threonine-protein kinase